MSYEGNRRASTKRGLKRSWSEKGGKLKRKEAELKGDGDRGAESVETQGAEQRSNGATGLRSCARTEWRSMRTVVMIVRGWFVCLPRFYSNVLRRRHCHRAHVVRPDTAPNGAQLCEHSQLGFSPGPTRKHGAADAEQRGIVARALSRRCDAF
jgi:hypothetical protein